jgi:UDP-N-acetylglucosamine--N-acetylmuramyl-(pentapeptide) pyrophosphoryl-undecaprenol N-acetylglucosamine transferase
MKIVIAAGGTGGHIYPGIAVAEEFISSDNTNKVLFISGRTPLEKRLIEKEKLKGISIHVKGLERKVSLKAIWAPFISFLGFIESLILLAVYKPKAVVLTGGYVSLPVALAAKILRIKSILLEQNVLPGFTSRLLSRFVDHIVLSFAESKEYIKGDVLGNPVRKRILNGKKTIRDVKNILIIGGSQGALSINRAICSKLDQFVGKNISITHLLGDRDYTDLTSKIELRKYPFYHPISYMYNIEEGLMASDLVVSRAGATAIAEFLVLGIPSILIPFPYAAERHQDLNARVLKDAGAACVLLDSDLSGLTDLMLELIGNNEKLDSMSKAALALSKPNAAKEIVKLIYD